MAGQSLFIPHGGGPMPLLNDPSHHELIAYLQSIEATSDRPSAIVVVSAHWECPNPTITSGLAPALYFDYYGFPPETYELSYPAPGSPELAQRIAGLLHSAGFEPALDAERGFDHGMFVPLMLMYPDASIPVVQLSLLADLDPARHVEMGAALAPLLDDDVLILGSGLSFHNMQAFGTPADEANEAFDRWLDEVCTNPALDDAARQDQLVNWSAAPEARYNHPREEHLLPLHVCFGAGDGAAAKRTFDGHVLNKRVAGYSW
jgi:aromatic ring-opening dioxygenase catalytic subunit (LigB family)